MEQREATEGVSVQRGDQFFISNTLPRLKARGEDRINRRLQGPVRGNLPTGTGTALNRDSKVCEGDWGSIFHMEAVRWWKAVKKHEVRGSLVRSLLRIHLPTERVTRTGGGSLAT